ncbi:MAG: PAS domain S-box protein [Bacteroidetes bacterium]|nr:PAS domain S-box protein [Bacteroidota bacterium]
MKNDIKKQNSDYLEKRILLLEKENQLLKKTQELSNIGIYELDLKSGIFFWSEETYKIFGYNAYEIVPTLDLVENAAVPDSKKKIKIIFDEIMKNEKKTGKYSINIIQPNGDKRFLYVSFVIAGLSGKKPNKVYGTFQDVTKKKLAEKALMESEEKFRKIIEQAADGIFVGNSNGDFIDVNAKACEITGYSKKELLTMNMVQLFSKNEMKKKPLYYDSIKTEQTVINERVLLRKDKTSIDIEMSTKLMLNGTFQATMRNISERKKYEEFLLKYQCELETLVKKRTQELEKTNIKLKKENEERLYTEELLKLRLKEKEILLKEIHHRVKNNMQVIISLLNLQAANINDKKILEIYQESQNRIKSMALIHEKLYQSEEFTYIDFSDYIKSLTSYLLHTYSTSSQKIKIIINTQSIPLEFDTMISLGLIVNELVSNSLKYAFKKCKNGKLEISLKKISAKGGANELCLVICDNGDGFPQKIDFRNTHTLGLQLVCSLTEQINGTISLTNTNGTKFIIKFPLKEK